MVRLSRLTLPLVLSLSFVVLSLASRACGAERPNLVLLLADDIAWTDYGFMGHSAIRTPRLDQLARESLLFTRGYVPTSLCRASLMSLVTGRYPHEHGVTGNDPPKGTDRTLMLAQIRRNPSLPRQLAGPAGSSNGYLSFQAGKWWEGRFTEGGFTHGMTHGDPAKSGRHGDEGLKIGRQGLEPIRKFLDETQGRPFFLWYAPMLPHQPHNPPERLLAKYQATSPTPHIAKYHAMCEWFDETCGQLLDELDRRNLRDNTLVVYLADNGWIQEPEQAKFAPRSKRSPYDGGLRTPIMIRWPGHVAARRDESSLVSSLDVVPTFLAAAGVPADPSQRGVNLAQAPEKLAEGLKRPGVFGAIFEHDQPNLDDSAAGLLYRWCVADDWKLIVPRGAGPSELYRITADPFERENLLEREPQQRKRLSDLLDAWWREASP